MKINRQIDRHMHIREPFSSGQLRKIPVYVAVLVRDTIFGNIPASSGALV